MSLADTAQKKASEFINPEMIDKVVRGLVNNQAIRKNTAKKGRLNIDRPLPFLCVYRKSKTRADKGTAHLIMGEAAYLVASGERESEQSLSQLVESISKTLADKFGAFLIIEVWAAKSEKETGKFVSGPKAQFRIFTDKINELPSTIETLEESLASLELLQFQNEVEIVFQEKIAPPGMKPLLSKKRIRNLSCLLIGLEIAPIYRDAETGEVYLAVLLDFRRKLSAALQQTFFEFVHVQTPERPTQPQMLGRRIVVDAVWSADAELSGLSDQFNYLLAVTPVNTARAFAEFKKTRFESEPVFHYRLLTIDPDELKRQLYSISFDKIEDPTMAYLLRDKRIELDRQITLIEDRNTPRFIYESLQLFPPVEDELMALAESILSLPKGSAKSHGKLSTNEIADLARREIEYYRESYAEMTATVEIRNDTPAGLMVSQGNLMIGQGTAITNARINALLQHEIGTHSVTYYNGRAQPLKLLYSGLPGYEQLQEGLAVFAEYLVGGLSFARLRTLAARVIAVRRLTEGKKFAEVFNELHQTYKFSARSTFDTVTRVFRGGGLTKDAVYLRGLVEVLKYLGNGGDIETLFVGKMGPEHVSIIRELQWRGILKPAPLVPRYMTFPETTERLKCVNKDTSVLDLI